jgi:hypothetical protein
MTRTSLPQDVRRYIAVVLDRIGRAALQDARGRLGVIGRGPAITTSSALLRENPARQRLSFAPLYDEGGMRASLRAQVDPSNLSVSLGATGPSAFKAYLHERGYSFEITSRMANYFLGRAGRERGKVKNAYRFLGLYFKANVGGRVSVQPRPFMAPALKRAVQTVFEGGFYGRRADFDLARDLFDIWGTTTKTNRHWMPNAREIVSLSVSAPDSGEAGDANA